MSTIVTVERDDHILRMGLNRAEKRNAFNMDMLRELSLAYGELDRDPELRCGVVFAHGDHFTAGLDLLDVGPNIDADGFPVPEGGVDFTGLYGEPVTKPIVVAIHGRCLTLGIEIALAADIRVAASDATFAQIEIKRGIMPFGGATIRMVRDFGWGNAMRYLLSGDEFDAEEAYRIGLVQHVVAPGEQLEAAMAIARAVAAQAPLGVQASLRNARVAWREGEAAAASRLFPELVGLMATDDAREGIQSFVERRDGSFTGR